MDCNTDQTIDIYKQSQSNQSTVYEKAISKDNLNMNTQNWYQILFEKILNFHEISLNPRFQIKKQFSDFSLNPELNFKHGLMTSFISDKLYQAHVETNLYNAMMYERALELIQSKREDKSIKLLGYDADVRDVWHGFSQGALRVLRDLIQFSKIIPGFDRLSENDFKTVINEKLFYYVIIKNSKLIIDDESYMVLPNNIQYSKSWFIKTVGIELTNKLFDFYESFNELNMTLKEISALVPYIITLPGNFS